MLLKEATARLTQSELANIGAGEVAYIRKMDWNEVSRCFPEAPDIDPEVDLRIDVRRSTSGRFSAPMVHRFF